MLEVFVRLILKYLLGFGQINQFQLLGLLAYFVAGIITQMYQADYPEVLKITHLHFVESLVVVKTIQFHQ